MICDVPFTGPDVNESEDHRNHQKSLEHIFPAALGGIWAEPELICKSCNDWTGHTLDHHLSTLFRPLIAVLGIRHGRDGHIPNYEYQQDGQKITLNPMTGEVFDLSLERPTETEPGKVEMSAQPGRNAHVTRSLKGFVEKTLGWDVTKLGPPVFSSSTSSTGTTPIVLDFTTFEQEKVKAAVSKIALLGAAALLGTHRFNQLDTRVLRQVVRLKQPSGLVAFPDGSPMVSRFGHGVTLHLLEDGCLAVLVTLFGACSFLVPLASLAPTWSAGSLPGRVLLPTDEELISGASPRATFGSPNIPRAMAALNQLNLEMQPYVLEQAANRRAWTAAGFSGQPGDKALSEEEAERFLEYQQQEFQIAGVQ